MALVSLWYKDGVLLATDRVQNKMKLLSSI